MQNQQVLMDADIATEKLNISKDAHLSQFVTSVMFLEKYFQVLVGGFLKLTGCFKFWPLCITNAHVELFRWASMHVNSLFLNIVFSFWILWLPFLQVVLGSF